MKVSKLSSEHSNKSNYKKLFENRPLLVSKEFSIWLADNNLQVNTVRFGVIVIKKNIKKAVARNKAKRIAKELFKLNIKQNHLNMSNKDLILVIKHFYLKEQLSTWKEKLLGVYRWLGYFANGI